MPLQNRVTPSGDLIATPHRGTLTGNRGVLHDAGRTIRRPFVGRRWIVCVLEFKDRRRVVMSPGRYTELFFLDEATALAAGHRPCAECQRERFELFRTCWADGRPKPSAVELDAALHAERLTPDRGKRTYRAETRDLPPGVMVRVPDDPRAWLITTDGWREWTPSGYGPVVPVPVDAVDVLTPASVARAIAAGYPVTTASASASP